MAKALRAGFQRFIHPVRRVAQTGRFVRGELEGAYEHNLMNVGRHSTSLK